MPGCNDRGYADVPRPTIKIVSELAMNTSEATATSGMREWRTINWARIERRVFKLQKRIYQATRNGEKRIAKSLQRILSKSYYAKLLAVRQVSQLNQGKKTAGVDGIKSLTPKQRLEMANNLKLGTKAKPVRRVWIPKPGKEKKRPLGIPTMYDRAQQALGKLVLEPQWEARFEGTSYGFRPGRSAHDAIGRIFQSIKITAKYVLDADIAKCFDRINHLTLLAKIDSIKPLKRQIKQWLKAGILEDRKYKRINAGTPQGGVISPLLANIALDGLIRDIQGSVKKKDAPTIVRYADDFVVLHEKLEIIHQSKELIEKWLLHIGLELSEVKTEIRHTRDGERPGFDFLGFNLRQWKRGKHHSGKTGGPSNRLIGHKTHVSPSQKAKKTHRQALKKIVEDHKSVGTDVLITKLNPVIRGWSNYYSIVSDATSLWEEDNQFWHVLRGYANRRKGRKSLGKSMENLFTQKDGRQVFTSKGLKPKILLKHGGTETRIHRVVRPEASPYDGNWLYWSERRGKHPETPKRIAKLLKKHKGKCNHCNNYFMPEDLIEVDHIVPRSEGGSGKYDNLQLLHRHCHDVKTAMDVDGIHNQEIVG